MCNKVITEDLQMIINSGVNWQTMAGKCVLISGANGFLPAYLVEILLYLNVSWDKKLSRSSLLFETGKRPCEVFLTM